MKKGPKGRAPLGTPTGIDRKLVRPRRKKLNAVEKKVRKALAIQLFVKQSGRKAQRGVEPNDRKYSHETQKAVGLMKPTEFYDLSLNTEED